MGLLQYVRVQKIVFPFCTAISKGTGSLPILHASQSLSQVFNSTQFSSQMQHSHKLPCEIQLPHFFVGDSIKQINFVKLTSFWQCSNISCTISWMNDLLWKPMSIISQNLLVLEELPGALTSGDNNSHHSQGEWISGSVFAIAVYNFSWIKLNMSTSNTYFTFTIGCFNDNDRAHLATDQEFKRPHKLGEEESLSLSNKPDCDIISVDRMTASWYMDHDRPVLYDISFTLNKVHH